LKEKIKFMSNDVKCQPLIDMLMDIHKHKRTGYLYIRTSGRAGIITVSNGEILKVVYRQFSGKLAVENILNDGFNDLKFTPVDKVSSLKDPDGDELFGLLKSPEKKSLRPLSSTAALAVDFHREARRLIEDVYGASGSKKVDSIAVQFSPQEQPREFLDKCRELLSISFGEEKAWQQFEKLYKQLV